MQDKLGILQFKDNKITVQWNVRLFSLHTREGERRAKKKREGGRDTREEREGGSVRPRQNKYERALPKILLLCVCLALSPTERI